MKKAVILLCLVLLLSLLAGCGAAENPPETTPEAPIEVPEQPQAEIPDEGTASSEIETLEEPEDGVPENEVTGDPSAEDAFVIWGWNNDFANIQAVLEERYPELASRIVFVNANSSDYYQDKMDVILDQPYSELYPDMMLLEVDYVQKYVNSDYLIDVTELGITDKDMSKMYEYNIQLGTDNFDITRALFWQATPGSIQIRADLAEIYLGTTDPAVLQSEYFGSWEKIIETARMVNEASGGMVKLLSGSSDAIRVFLNSSRQVGWYDENDVIQVDDLLYDYMELCKTLYEDETTFNTQQWGEEWAAQKNGDGVETEAALAYFGCPWYTYWCLTDVWEANTILVQGPAQFFWGGTGLAVTANCSDLEMAATILKAATCDKDFMIKINERNGDYMNNTEVIDYLLENGIGNSSKMANGQNLIAFYAESADAIDASTITDVDQKTQYLFQAQADLYAMGEKDMQTAIADFKASVHNLYGFLKVS